MQKIREIFNQHKYVYLVLLLTLLIFTGIFVMNRYAIDTYYLEGYGYKNNAMSPYFKDGRLIMTAFLGVMGLFNVSFSLMKICSWLLAVVSLYISMLLMYHTFDKVKKGSNALKILLSFTMIFSIFVTEYFMFPEYTGVMCVGILLPSIATFFLINYFETKQKKNLLVAYIMSFLAAFCYQGTLSLLVLLPIVFTLKYSKNIKQFIINNFVIAIGYGIPSLTSLIVSKVSGSTRAASSFDFELAFSKISEGVKTLLGTTFSILPKYLFIVMTLVLIIVIICNFLRKKDEINKSLFVIYTVLAVVIVTLVPHFIINPQFIWLVPRSNIGLGLLCVVPVACYFIYSKENNYINYTIWTIFIILLSFQFKGITNLVKNQNMVNILDKVEAMKIKNSILEYEKDHNTINKIVVYSSKTPVYQYPDTLAVGDMNVRVFANDWSGRSIVSLVTNRHLNEDKKDKKIEKECRKKLKEEPNENHMIFKDETLHLCTY